MPMRAFSRSVTPLAPLLCLALCLALSLLLRAGVAQAASPQAGEAFPDARVKHAPQPAEAQYLGLPAGASGWRLSDIKAEALLIEVYSMYCPRCQADAPAVNRVFERLAASPEGARLKMLGVAAGNSPFEVEFYRKKYQVRMPLAPDADYALHKAFGTVGTPSFFVLRRAPGGGFTIAYFKEGHFGEENEFYEQVLRAAGLGASGAAKAGKP